MNETYSLRQRILTFSASMPFAAAIWIGVLRFVFAPGCVEPIFAHDRIHPTAAAIAARQIGLWQDPEKLAAAVGEMRRTNPEWDFMGRSYLVWSLANMCLRNPERRPEYLKTIDAVIDDTLARERESGFTYFLLPYVYDRRFRLLPKRSQFVDGEIALMLGLRRLVGEKDEYAPPHRERVEIMVQRMREAPVMCLESYPDECWMFDNANALAATKLLDVLDGTDHADFFSAWLECTKRKLVDQKTGLLVSSFSYDGANVSDGPEGSSIWQVAYTLSFVYPEFAHDQYVRARHELKREFAGFGWAWEWPATWTGPCDVDSGPVIAGIEVSAGASGLALVAAHSFGDRAYTKKLLTTLEFAAFPTTDATGKKYAASNQLGDAVLLYSLVLGPTRDEVVKRSRHEK